MHSWSEEPSQIVIEISSQNWFLMARLVTKRVGTFELFIPYIWLEKETKNETYAACEPYWSACECTDWQWLTLWRQVNSCTDAYTKLAETFSDFDSHDTHELSSSTEKIDRSRSIVITDIMEDAALRCGATRTSNQAWCLNFLVLSWFFCTVSGLSVVTLVGALSLISRGSLKPHTITRSDRGKGMNKKSLNVSLPTYCLIAMSGTSGQRSGKLTLISSVLLQESKIGWPRWCHRLTFSAFLPATENTA